MPGWPAGWLIVWWPDGRVAGRPGTGAKAALFFHINCRTFQSHTIITLPAFRGTCRQRHMQARIHFLHVIFGSALGTQETLQVLLQAILLSRFD